MSGYVSNVPLSNQSLGQTQPAINTNFTVLNTNFGVDHVDFTNAPPSSGGNGGRHNLVSLVQQGSNPSAASSTNILYTKSVTYPNAAGTFNELFMRRSTQDSSTVVQLTTGPANPSASADGYTFLPGGIILQWGNYTINAPSTSVAVTFPLAFPNTCWSVVITGLSPVSGSTAAFSGLSRTGFNGIKLSTATSVYYNYIAIGN